MSRLYENEYVYISDAVKKHLNTWTKKPVQFDFENIHKDPPALMIQPLSTTEKIRTYINGSYIAAWRFAVYCRVAGMDTAERLDAYGLLNELAEWLAACKEDGSYANLPVIDENRIVNKIEMESTPSLAVRYENGVEDYQAVFTLEYKYIRRT